MTEVKLRLQALADDQLFFSEENERKASRPAWLTSRWKIQNRR